MKLFDFTADKNKLSSQIKESITANEEENINESLQALAKHVKEGSSLCACLLYTSPSPRDRQKSRMPSSA